MIRSALAALAIAFASGSAAGQPVQTIWIVGTSRDALGESRVGIEFMDTARIEISGTLRRAWQWNFFGPRHQSGVRRAIALAEYDCRERRYRHIQLTVYRREGDETLYPQPVWTFAVPGSHEETLLAFVCSNHTQRLADERFIQLAPDDTMEAAAAAMLDHRR